MSEHEITVSLADLALVLYLPKPTVDYGEPVPNPRVHGNHPSYPNAKCATCGQPAGAHYCAPREAARRRLEDIVQRRLDAAVKKALTPPPVRRSPTQEQIEAARKRLAPYIGGYPQPMYDTRYLRVANGTATQEEMDAVAAEEIVWREVREAQVPRP